jgi:hypothetical protein
MRDARCALRGVIVFADGRKTRDRRRYAAMLRRSIFFDCRLDFRLITDYSSFHRLFLH